MAQFPTVKHLRYFVALAEHRHFGRAAAACCVSQSAFSLAIKELEGVLGVALVDRTKRRVTITATGQEVAVQAQRVLRDLEVLVQTADGAREPLAGPLRLGVIPTIAPFLLSKVLPALRERYPDLQLYLKEDVTERIHAELLTGSLDLLLIALPFELRNVVTMELFRDRFRLAARADTQHVDPQHYAFNRLHADSVLLLDDSHCLRGQAIAACRLKNLDKVNRFTATSLFTLLQMVESDLGITFLPEMAEDSALLKGTHIRTYPLREDSYRTIALAWRNGSAQGQAFRERGSFSGRTASGRAPSGGSIPSPYRLSM
jgi:LysR family hydrogen peroxide-inducible transcriptional activator